MIHPGIALGIGLALFLLGFSHTFLKASPFELRVLHTLQDLSSSEPIRRFFQEIWFFGRTSFALSLLILLSCLNWQLGLVALAVFGAAAGSESLIKALVGRQRPFASGQGVAMLQPRQPLDPSFPSGDVLRAWYLALITSVLLNTPAYWMAAVVLAVIVSLGRMIMGVHYLSDVIAGAGLGWIAGGITIWLWQLFRLLG